MDRTSILGDTIDYMKELMEKIQDLKENDIESHDVDKLKLMGRFNMNEESQVRNPPKVRTTFYNLILATIYLYIYDYLHHNQTQKISQFFLFCNFFYSLK